MPSEYLSQAFSLRCYLVVSLLALVVSACGRDASQPDLLADASPSGESPWLAAERQRFSDLLSASPADVLVVPFQTAGYGFDAAERSLLAARIANYLHAHSGLSVADPQLVGRALGEGWRRLDDTNIQALATAMQASHVVIGELGHDRNSSFHIAIRTWSSKKPGVFDDDVTRAERSWDLAFSDAEYPHQVFADHLPGVAGMLSVDIIAQSAAPQSPPAPSAADDGVPELDSLLEQPSVLSADRVDLLQLAALAYPWTPDRPVARGWVRTLKLAWRLPADEPDRTLLIARALAHLGRRPAALALLADARSPAERTLREWLNGNLPQGEREAADIEDPVQRLIAHIELGDLRWTYGHTSGERERELLADFLSKDSQWWPVLLSRLSSGSESWASEYLLRYFPLSEPGWAVVRDRVEWLWEFARTSADSTAFDVASAATALEYYNQWLAEHSSDLTAGADGSWLLLDLLAARVEGNVFEGLGAIYGQPSRIDAAREEVAQVGRYFAGHPDYAAVKARLEWREYDRRLGAERAKWLAAALRDTEDAFYWAQELSRRLAPTAYHTPDIPEVSDRLRNYRRAYFWDLPGDVTWLPQGFRNNDRVRTHYRDTVIAYSVFQFQYFEWLLEQEEDGAWIQVVRDSLRNRFTGNPGVAKFHAAALRDSGDLAAAERVYRAVVSRESAPYSAYDRLAELLVEQGRLAEAFEVVDTYPGFAKDSGASAAYLANGAENSAMLFWRIGQFDFALALLRRSAGYDLATSPSMTSNAILAQERGDYRSAASILMTQARRYRDFEAVDEYLELAFALADYQPAWSLFEEVLRDGNGGQPLSRVARSVRTQGWSDQKVREWLSEDRIRSLADGTYRYAAHAAIAAFIVERDPPDDLPELVRDLQGNSPYVVDADGNVGRRNPDRLAKLDGVICGPSDYGSELDVSPGEPVDSHLLYFARGYLALENGEYAEAQHALEEAAGLFAYFAYGCENVSYLFPYLGLSAALNEDTERLTRYLDSIEFKHRWTHYYLARAALAGVAGKEDEALESLDKALYRWKSNRFRTVPTRYLYAEICRRLYELTGSDAYRDHLLWWLDVHERLNPAHSWAYAMEARLSTDPAVKRRALAMTLLLDRNSISVKVAEESELEAARQWLVENNPFR